MRIRHENRLVTVDELSRNHNLIVVFGDNDVHKGLGGMAKLFRNHPQSYGFITKKYPSNYDSSFYHPNEYEGVFHTEMQKLTKHIRDHKDKTYLISQIGNGLANKYKIWENVIYPNIEQYLYPYRNQIILLWN